MDKLCQCANAFKSLINYNYHIIIGRKGKLVDITLEFNELDFHHLMGLNKLKDLRLSKQKREDVFNDIINGKITYDTIRASRYISDIENRFEPLSNIEYLLDTNRIVFKYNDKQSNFSLIEADYLMSTPYQNNDIYIFIAEKENKCTCFCRSFFPKEFKDYTVGQASYTMLYKEKITVCTGEKQVQYNRLS